MVSYKSRDKSLQKLQIIHKRFVIKIGCNSPREQQELIAQRRGHSSIEDYLEELKLDREVNQQLKSRAESKYESLLTQKRRNNKLNQIFRKFMKKEMKRTGMTISDIWRETEISKQMISQYV